MDSPLVSLRPFLIIAFILSVPLFVNYVFMWITYHWVHHNKDRQVPPVLPSFFPSLDNSIHFLFDGARFVRKATQYDGHATCVCVPIAFNDMYFIQDSESVAAMWRQQQLASPIYIYTYALRNLFGMPASCLKAYQSDRSGPFKKPFPDSDVAPHNRVDHLMHASLARAFSGPGLQPAFERFKRRATEALDECIADSTGNKWFEHPNMLEWSRDVLGKALVEAIFGKRLLELNPSFMNDIWDFDDYIPWFAKRVPQFLMPGAYNKRRGLLQGIQRWYEAARKEYKEGNMYPDGDGDPVWGSYLMRERQTILLSVEGHSDEGLAAADLGLIWASVTNVISSAMMMALHIWKDETLLSRIRGELPIKPLSQGINDTHLRVPDVSCLEKLPLLNSVYAETLRCHVQAFITRGGATSDLATGSWWLPRSEIAIVSSHVCHMDENVWNTQGGKHPVDSFWSDRFLVKKGDKMSGPLKPDLRARMGLESKTRKGIVNKSVGGSIHGSDMFCDLRGLEGSWIPYGGGFGACPGRLLTKRLMLWYCTYMTTHYDIDILTKKWKIDNSRYGFGMQKPKGDIAFRMRKR